MKFTYSFDRHSLRLWLAPRLSDYKRQLGVISLGVFHRCGGDCQREKLAFSLEYVWNVWLREITSTILIRLMRLCTAVRADVVPLQIQRYQYRCLHTCQPVNYMKYARKMCRKAICTGFSLQNNFGL